MGASYPTRIILAFRSGGVCAFPKCGKHLTYDAQVGDDTYVGEAAHIRVKSRPPRATTPP